VKCYIDPGIRWLLQRSRLNQSQCTSNSPEYAVAWMSHQVYISGQFSNNAVGYIREALGSNLSQDISYPD
jgi:hypothetical protein